MKKSAVLLAAFAAAGVAGAATIESVGSFGKLTDGSEAHLWRMKSDAGLVLEVTDFGGRVVRALAPDRDGKLADVTLGWNTPAEYEKLGFCVGTLIGRFGNRIRDGKFTLDGTDYQLPLSETTPEPRHCNLHSGPKGWDTKIWNVKDYREGENACLSLTCVSEDGECGFPGTVSAKVVYTVTPKNVWRIDYELTTDKPTIVNPTHHTYWNLAGEASGNVLKQELKVFADQYTQTDDGLIPTKHAPVAGTGFDFTELRPIGAKMEWMKANASKATTLWYDHNFVLRGKIGELHPAVTMFDPASGRALEVWTTEPGLQMYGAQDFTAALPAKAAGAHLCPFAGLALETQHFPDSPNRPDFPSTVLRPGQVFKSTTEYRFHAVAAK